jgi:hypothetical protein
LPVTLGVSPGTAIIFAPASLLRVSEQISASDMVMVTDLGAAQAMRLGRK